MARLKKYALYKGDELVAEGTIEQIATKMGMSQNTVRFYKTPTSKRRYNPETRTALVEADYYDFVVLFYFLYGLGDFAPH